MKISFVTTVFNEEKTIQQFLESIFLQTKLPDEVVIVDGGSSDHTVAKIKNQSASWRTKTKNQNIRFIILTKKGNRAVGRNEAIKNATGDIIACSDAGCWLDKKWLEKITNPFEDSKIDVVAGYYKPVVNNIFQKCLSTYTCVMPDKVDRSSFLPSSRSVAFKKKAWEKVNGYPQNLDTCEDLVFAKRLKKEGFTFKFVEDAIVYWPQRENIIQAFFQFFHYAEGDGMAHYFRPQTPVLFMRYAVGLVLLILFFVWKSDVILYIILISIFLYLLWAILKNYRYVKKWQAVFVLPLLQITADIAVMIGTSCGLLKSMKQ